MDIAVVTPVWSIQLFEVEKSPIPPLYVSNMHPTCSLYHNLAPRVYEMAFENLFMFAKLTKETLY